MACRAKKKRRKESSQPRKPLGPGVASPLPFHGKTVLTGQKRSLCGESWTWAGLWDPLQHILADGASLTLNPFTGCPGPMAPQVYF